MAASVMQARHADPLFLGCPRLSLLRRRRAAAVHRKRDQHERLFGAANADALREGRHQQLRGARATEAVNPAQTGTKAAAHYHLTVGAGAKCADGPPAPDSAAAPASYGKGARLAGTSTPRSPARRRPTSSTQRHPSVKLTPTWPASCARRWPGCSGAKQFFYYDVDTAGSRSIRQRSPPAVPAQRRQRPQRAMVSHAQRRRHLHAGQVGVSLVRRLGPGLPHLALALVDPDFAKAQLDLMLRERLPASQRPDPRLRVELRRCEPAGACLGHHLHLRDKAQRGEGDIEFLKRLSKLLLNFTWWVNRKDRGQQTSSKAASSAWTTSASSTAARRCPPAAGLEQADGTAWMAFFSQNMLEIAVELALHDPVYEGHGV
jgi:hypothetical protein